MNQDISSYCPKNVPFPLFCCFQEDTAAQMEHEDNSHEYKDTKSIPQKTYILCCIKIYLYTENTTVCCMNSW